MTEIATIDWFGRWGTSVFSENTAIFLYVHVCEQFSAGSKSRHIINKKLSVKVFFPLFVSDQRLEGCQIIVLEKKTAPNHLQTIYTRECCTHCFLLFFTKVCFNWVGRGGGEWGSCVHMHAICYSTHIWSVSGKFMIDVLLLIFGTIKVKKIRHMKINSCCKYPYFLLKSEYNNCTNNGSNFIKVLIAN